MTPENPDEESDIENTRLNSVPPSIHSGADTVESEKQRILNKIRSGKYAVPGEPLTERFMREKQEEIAREERRWLSENQ